MSRRPCWGIGSCCCGYWLHVGVAPPPLASSERPLILLRRFSGSLSFPPSSIFSSPFPLPYLPPSLSSCHSRPRSRSTPRPRPSSRPCFQSIFPGALFSSRYLIVGQAPGHAPDVVGYLQASPPIYRDDAACGMKVPGLLPSFFPDGADTRALLLSRFPLHYRSLSRLRSSPRSRSRPS